MLTQLTVSAAPETALDWLVPLMLVVAPPKLQLAAPLAPPGGVEAQVPPYHHVPAAVAWLQPAVGSAPTALTLV